MFLARWRASPSATASMVAGLRQHADLHRVDSRDRKTPRRSARAMKSAGTSWIALTPCVFCAVSAVMTRRAIDAERGKGLQIRLDAGAAARIRAGDGDGDRGHGAPSPRQRAIDHRAQLLRGLRRIGRQRQRRNHRHAVGAGRDHLGGIAGIDAGDGADRKSRLARAHRLHDARASRQGRSAPWYCPSRSVP